MKSGGFYSFTVYAEEEVPLPEHLLLIEPGVNHFNARIDDIDAFLAMLKEAKVVVGRMCSLNADAFDASADLACLGSGEMPV